MLLALSSNQKLGLALVAAAFVAFALVSAVLIPRSRPDFPGRRLNLFVGVAALFTVAMLAAVVVLAKESEHEAAEEPVATETTPTTTEATTTETTEPTTTEATTETTETGETTTTEAAGDPVAGKSVFASAGCAACHTLADAGSTGSVGPNLDAASPSQDKVVERVTEGKGAMPSFEDSLTPAQIQDVAAYVSSAAGS